MTTSKHLDANLMDLGQNGHRVLYGGHFPWGALSQQQHGILRRAAREINHNRRRALDALMRQARACHDARACLAQRGLFGVWIESQTTLSRRSAYRLADCWQALGKYHLDALHGDYTSPLHRFDAATLVHTLGARSLCSPEFVDALMQKTLERIRAGECLVEVSRESVLKANERWRYDQSQLRIGGHREKSLPGPDRQHLRPAYRVLSRDQQRLDGPVTPAAPTPPRLHDEQGRCVPEALHAVFTHRQQFTRLRRLVEQTARDLHALCRHPAGRDLHRLHSQRLLAISDDLNLSCPALVDGDNWLSLKSILKQGTRETVHDPKATHPTRPQPGPYGPTLETALPPGDGS